MSSAEKPVAGDNTLRCLPTFEDCIYSHTSGQKPRLIAAFAFGVHPELNPSGVTGQALAWCESPNEPGFPYTAVEHSDRFDEMGMLIQTGPQYLAYEGNEQRGWGFVSVWADPGSQPPWGGREGYGAFGPMDSSANDVNAFAGDIAGAGCEEELYDSFIGCSNWVETRKPGYPALRCDETVTGGERIPCSEVDPTWPAQGLVFRVDVPDGDYRFVAAVGSPDSLHAHRVIAEDGGTGRPGEILGSAVTLVWNFDQAQWWHGEADPESPGAGVFARVGFDGRMPPLGDRTPPDPIFVNMDMSGRETFDCAESPMLEVTEGYILFHLLQACSISGCGGPREGRDSGSDLVLLEIWKVGQATTELFKRGDTNCDGGMNVADAVYMLMSAFCFTCPRPCCKDAADANDDEGINIADAVYILQNLFAQGPPIPPPGPFVCGRDLTGKPGGGPDLPRCEYPFEKCR